MTDTVNLPQIEQEAAYLYSFTWTAIDPDTGVETPVDTTGYAARLEIKSKITDVSPLADWSTANGKIEIVGNKFNIYVPGTETKTYSFTTAVYDLLVWKTADPGNAFKLASGTIAFNKSVTTIPV